MRVTWAEHVQGMPPGDIALLEAYRALVMALPDVDMRVHRTEITFARKRSFTACFIMSHRLELAIHLLRRVEHPRCIHAGKTTRQVWTHRLTLRGPQDLDDGLRALVHEAWETVGPGTRRLP